MALDIYNYPKRLEQTIRRLGRGDINPKNQEIILRFYDDCSLQGLSKPRLIRTLDSMIYWGSRIRAIPFDTATIDDIKRLVRQLEDRDLKPWSKATHKVILKKFYKWLKGNNESYPPEIKWLKANIKPKDLPMVNADAMITDDEVKRAMNACDHPRNKALLGVLFESGCRVGEIGTLAIKNVSFDNQGAILNVNGKTGSRRVRILNSAPLLATWLNNHPKSSNPEAAVWINIGATNWHEPMRYRAITKAIEDAFRKAGIDKRCNPHSFRHARASMMANHLTEFQMNHYFGWKQGSDMPATYVHLSGRDLDGAIMRINGFEEVKPIVVEAKPKICYTCQALNAIDSKYCGKCAGVLGTKDQKPEPELNTRLQALLQQTDVQEFLMKKMAAMTN